MLNLAEITLEDIKSKSNLVKSSFNRIFFLNALQFNSEKEVIASIINKESHVDALNSVYSRMDSLTFKDKYEELLDHLIETLGCDIAYQARPTVRIQWPGTRAGNFHIDTWVGHGKSTFNFWVPITETGQTNTIWIANQDDSEKLVSVLVDDKVSLKAFEDEARNHMYPINVSSDEIFIFNDKTLHGSIVSKEKDPRVSLDFRLATPPYDIGSKKIYHDYKLRSNAERNKFNRQCGTIVYSSGKYSHLSHIAQRLVIKEHCSKNNVVNVAEASEFYSTSHLPQIQEWIDKYPDREIVVFSKDCFCNKELLFELANKHNPGIYDALAGKRL